LNDDDRLISATLAGDAAAFGQLVCKYQDRLYNTLAHIVGSAEDAQDLVQEAFLQAFTKLETFRGRSAFYTWLYRIAFNLAISHKRRRRPAISVEQEREQCGHEPIDNQQRPEDGLLQKERADLVRDGLAALKEEHRTILVLREMEGCCYESIADILEMPVGTVRSRLHRARSQLREQLQQVLQAESG